MPSCTRLGLSLALTASFAAAPFAFPVAGIGEDPCDVLGQCHLPRWIPDVANASDQVGYRVEIDGTTAFVAAPGGDAVYVYELIDNAWEQTQTLLDPLGTGNGFGEALGLSGDLAAIGAPSDDTHETSSGAAHLYQRIGGAWVLTETAFASTPESDGRFGAALDVDGIWLGVGSPGALGEGRVYAYLRTFESWNHTWTISGTTPTDEYGSAIAVSENESSLSAQFIVGDWSNDNAEGTNAGAIYHSLVSVNTHAQSAPTTVPGLQGNDYFGYSIAFNGLHLAVGAHGDDDVGTAAGAVYVFEVEQNVAHPDITLRDKLVPCDGFAGNNFGFSVDMDENSRIGVGAPNQELAGFEGGTAYTFSFASLFGNWALQNTIQPGDGNLNDYFGCDVAVGTNSLLVGAYGVDDAGDGRGAAYFVSQSSQWVPGGACPCDDLAAMASYGTGKPGSVGVPELGISKLPVVGESTLVGLSNALPGVAPILLWGFVPTALPFDDGELYVADIHLAILPVVSVLGQVGMLWNVPSNPAMCGIDVFAQALFLDPGASGPYHTAQSNGLQMSIGY